MGKILRITGKSSGTPCRECAMFPNDPLPVGDSGFSIVYCEDGVIRMVDVEKGCAWWGEDEYFGLDVN